jgi:lipoate-protein ligase A
MKRYTVQVRTGRNTWSIIDVDATDSTEAARIARRILGGRVVEVI